MSAYVCAIAVRQFISMNGQVYRMEQIRQSMKLQYELYAQKTKNDETVQRMYHDLKKQLRAIEVSGGSAENLAASMNRSLEQMNRTVYTENPILNAIEAAAECPRGEGVVTVRYTETSAYKLTVIENTFAGQRNPDRGTLSTTKTKEKGYHGIGM